MKLYRVTTTFLGADGPSKLYFDTEAKAKAFMESECQNGDIALVDVIADYKLNYSDGCTMNDLTFGDFNAKEIELIEAGWKTTKSLGDVYLNERGKVVRAVRDGKTVYPYRWDARLGCWNNCSGYYTIAYLSRLMREGKAIWA